MKIEFIDGRITNGDDQCICRFGIFICGEYLSNTKFYYKSTFHRNYTCDVMQKSYSCKIVRVVKQRSKWKTFRVLCHELTHYIFDTLLPIRLRDKCDDWLDREQRLERVKDWWRR